MTIRGHRGHPAPRSIRQPGIAQWRAQAEALESYQDVSVPLDVLIGESVEVATFVSAYWEPEGTHPGLRFAGDTLPATIADGLS